MNWKLRDVALLATLTLAFLWCVPSVAQVIKGSISGTVTDPQGAVVSGAQVSGTNTETGTVFTTTSDGAGLFRLNLIPVGTYSIQISAPGFTKAQNKTVSVTASADTSIGRVLLTIGDAATTVEVTAETPLIEPTQSQVTNTFSGTQLQTFAGVQENQGLDNLALFVPGVSASRSNNFSNANGVGFSVNGLRGRSNDQQIDGQNNNDNSVGGPGLFLTNPEFVQQYVIVTNQFGPEYGRNSGSVVNIITKSGGNSWHGSVYGSENNSYLNALSNQQKRFGRNANGNPLTGPPRSNEEFSGFALGGPVVKNKAFVFGGFDSDLFSGQTIYSSGTSTPTPAGLATLTGCFPGNQNVASLARFGPYGISAGNPQSIGLSQSVTVAGCPGVQISPVQRILATPGHEFDFVGKHDLQLGNDNIGVRYLFNRNNVFNQASSGGNSAAAGYVNNVTALSQDLSASWTHSLSSRMVNELRGSFGRLNVQFGGNSFGSVPTDNQLDQAVSNVTFQSTRLLGFGPATNIPQGRIVNTWQVQDNWNYTVGKHTLKAGESWTYQRSPNIFLPNINGQYRFGPFTGGSNSISNNLGSFIANTPNRVSIAEGTSDLDFREYDTFLYFGDDWKVRENLTLNLGLTWSYYGQPANLFNNITVPRESNRATALFANTDRFGNPIPLSARTFPQVNTPKASFGPSVGAAYTPQWGGFLTGHGKTVFRGGYRLLYDPPFYNIYLNISTSAPVSLLNTLVDANARPLPSTPTGPNARASLASALQNGVFDPRQFAQTNVPQSFGPDRVHSWSFGFEREITKHSAFEARYVGNHGTNLFQSLNGNPFIGALAASFPNLVPAGLTPCPASQAVVASATGRVNCNEGVIRSRQNSGFSDYNGLQLEYRATNLFNQLTVRSSYTYSKATDTNSEIFSTASAGNSSAFSQNPLNFTNAEHGTSGLDFPQRWTLTFTEELPFFKQQHGLVGHTLGGWSIAADYILASGQGFTPLQVVEATNTGGNFYDNVFNGTFNGFETARPFLGSSSAPLTSVGIYCGDARTLFGTNCASVGNNQLISLNALNTTGSVVAVTNNNVRFIENTGIAQQVFGTPFGNVGRNSVRDAISNVANLSIYKRFKFKERSSFEIHATALNVFNHFNFSSVDPFLLDAGLTSNGTGFGDPSLTGTNAGANGYRRLFIGGVLRF